MTNCRYDREREEYLRNGEPCRVDDYGDPTNHCTAKGRCANHIGRDDLTCARCVGETRQDIRAIVARAVELMPEAIVAGVDSQAAMLAAPGCPDLVAWTDRQRAMRAYLWTMQSLGRITEKRYIRARENMEPEDEQHPYTVLTRWQMMLSEDYGHQLPDVLTVENAAAYLERTLPRMAQDPEQDFPLFRREIRRCRSHVEAVLRDSQTPERGAPCPDCREKGHVVRLVREYGHWCDDDECQQQFHHRDDSGDRWVCPANGTHWWTQEGYGEMLKERDGARRVASA